MEIVAKIKEHPYLSATVVFVVGVALILYMRGGSSGAQTQVLAQDNSSAVAAGTAQQQAQLAYSADANHTAAALQAQEDTNATNLGIAQLAQTIQLNGQALQADTINRQTDAQVAIAGMAAQTQQQATALNASVQIAQFNAQTQQESIVAGAYANAAQIAASLQQYIVGKQAEVTEQQISANRDTALAANTLAREQANYQYLVNTNAINTAGAVQIHQSDANVALSQVALAQNANSQWLAYLAAVNH